MRRKRIHELAKEWGMESRQLLQKLEAAGIRGKKAQSSLREVEIAAVSPHAVAPVAPTVAVGEEKLVAERVVTAVDQRREQLVTAREEVRESRIRPNVIRRRTKRVEMDVPPATFPAALLPPEPDFGQPLVAPPPSLELPFVEPIMTRPEAPAVAPSAPAIAAAEEGGLAEPGRVEPLPALAQQIEPAGPGTQAEQADYGPAAAGPPGDDLRGEQPGVGRVEGEAAQPETAPPDRAIRPSRILGRIDLDKLSDQRTVRIEAKTRQAASPTTPGLRNLGTPPINGGADVGQRRGKKRKRIIAKADLPDLQDREMRLPRGLRKRRVQPGKEQRQTEITIPKASKRIIRISEVITVGELARSLGVKVGEVIKKLMGLGVMATINQTLDTDTAALVASDFDYTVENVAFDADSILEVERGVGEDEGKLEARPPVVTIMGHVDHGKTSLLDAIRQTNVTGQEHGGITQHIGAYTVAVNSRSVTFVDTPGHAAFTSMRARGAKVTDIVTLVVAADDGVMPQTIEAVDHARAAHVPIIVAINKMDMPGADAERVKRELMTHGLVAEEFGGDTIIAPVSAKTGEGIPQLLDMLLLQADIMELRANADKLARGTIVEAKLDRGRGPVATVLVQEGELKVGDPFVCGVQYGRVRAMLNSRGDKVAESTPSMPVEILGLSGVPQAGDVFVVVDDEAKARQVAEHRQSKRRETDLTRSTSRASLEEFYQQGQAKQVEELRVIVKADVQGSVEAVSDALNRLSTDEVRLLVLHASVGGISESDVLLAAASKGIIIGFNIRPESKAAALAEREGVEIRLYNVIYELIGEVRSAMEGMLAPTYRENTLGRAEVREVFSVSRLGAVAGCFVDEGRLVRGAQARLVRDQAVVYTGRIATLRRFKDDVREVVAGSECGASLENYQDIKAGDILETYELEEMVRRLEPEPAAVGRRAS